MYLYLITTLFALSGGLETDSRDRSSEHAGPLISFGELTQVTLRGHELTALMEVERDILNPGGFIVGDGNGILQIDSNLTVELIAGKPEGAAFKNGFGRWARFATVNDIQPFNNGTELLVADWTNHCIRKVVIATKKVTTFAGKGRTDIGLSTTPVPAREVLLALPQKIIYIEEEKFLYYLTRTAVVKHDLESDTISPVILDLPKSYSFVIDSTKLYLYVSHSERGYGISRIDIVNRTLTRLTGQAATNHTSSPMSADHSLATASFLELADMSWLIQDQVLLVAETSTYSFRLVNLVDDKVTTICTGAESLKRSPESFLLGNTSHCAVEGSAVVYVIDGDIYTGSNRGTGQERQGFFLKLTYSQPVCNPPEAESNSSYTPVKDRYTHAETIIFECQEGYGVEDTYDTISCVRDLHPNGTVLGKWGKPSPKCAPVNLRSMSPKEGQIAGGTNIIAEGIFSKTLTVLVIYGNNITQAISLIQHNFGHDVQFRMPTKHVNSTSSNCTLKFLLSDGTTPAVQYTYLPNPRITAISRTSAIVSGGLDLKLSGDYISSAKSYQLQWLFPVDSGLANQTIVSQSCVRNTDHVTCQSPDLRNIYSKLGNITENRKGNVTEIPFAAVLVGDGNAVDVIGSKNFVFTIVDSQPSLDNSKIIMYNNDVTIDLIGSHLNTSLLPSDYQVTLIFPELSQNRSCKVNRLQFDLLQCQPILGGISRAKSGNNSWIVSIQVKVGNLDFSAGSISLDFSMATSIQDPKLRSAEIVISVLVPVAFIGAFFILAGCIVAWRRRIRRHRKHQRVMHLNMSMGKIKEEENCSWQQRLPEELRLTLENMYIEPSHLTFSIKAHEVGKGHFGKVYFGQLALKDDVLKTVAVKTLKETEDVTLDQVIDFLEEATFIKDFKHVNVLPTLGIVWREGDRPLVVLPYMALGDLQSLLRHSDTKYPAGDLLHFGLQIAAGMEFLTNNRVLHMDLAARNCLANEDYLVRIADFGMSQDVYSDNYFRVEDSEKPRPVKWMAIESLTSGVYNSRTEVWSFGVLMWELFAGGNTPYPGISNSEILYHLKPGYRLNRPPDMPPALFDFVSTCWLEDSAERPSFADIKLFFNQTLFKEENQQDEAEEPFQYSYVRKFTSLFPEGYDSICNSGQETNRTGYVDNAFTLDDYLKPQKTGKSNNTGAYVSSEGLHTVSLENMYTNTEGATPIDKPAGSATTVIIAEESEMSGNQLESIAEQPLLVDNQLESKRREEHQYENISSEENAAE